MEGKHTIKEVAKMFGISTDALRLYEKEGLITPERDEENGYRYYDEDTIQHVMGIIHYRRMDVGIKEIDTLINSASILEIMEKCDSIVDATDKKIDELQKKRARILDIREHLKEIDNKMGTFYIVQPEKQFIPVSNEKEIVNLHNMWNEETHEYLSYGHVCYVLEEEADGSIKAVAQEIHIRESMMDIAPFVDEKETMRSENVNPCVATVVSDKSPNKEDVITQMKAYASKLGLNYGKRIYCVYVFSTGGLKQPVNYFELYLPIIKK